MIRFTIATCCFNSCAQLPATLRSVASQDYAAVEHLIIDGASTDGSLSLLSRYQTTVNDQGSSRHVRLVSEPDSGLYDAMNKALRLAQGDFILFLNAGDRFHSRDTLSRVARAAQSVEGEIGVLYGDTDIVDSEGRFLRHRRLSPPERLTWRSFKRGMLVCHQAFFASTALARLCPYDRRYRFSADFDWCIRIMQLAEQRHATIVNTHTIIADYLDGGLTTQNHRRSLRERFAVMARHYGLLTTLLLHAAFVVRAIVKR